MLKDLMRVADETTSKEIKKQKPKKKLRKFVSPEKKRAMREKERKNNETTTLILFIGCSIWFVYLVIKLIQSLGK